mgnify:CR=1 FL=1
MRDRCAVLFTAFRRALPQIFHPAARSVLWRTLLLTLLLFAFLGAGVYALIDWGLARLGWATANGVLEAAAATLAMLAAGWLLFRAVAMAVMGLFADAIVEAVEGESWPDAARNARSLSFAASARLAIASLLRTIGWNIFALPLYVILLITGVGAPLLFIVLNAYLLGRDMADLVEPRHPGLPRFTGRQRIALGALSALSFMVPVFNLLAPILSAAMAVHYFHLRGQAG